MRFIIATALISSSASALAQPAVPTLEPDPIVVVGIRDGTSVGMVDYDKVWRRCAECKRALAKLTALSKPYHVKKGQIGRDGAAYEEAATKGLRKDKGEKPVIMTETNSKSFGSIDSRARELQAGRLVALIPDSQRKDLEELQTIRFDMTKLTASFLAQLEPHARAAAEEERVARSLAAIFDRNGKPPAAKVREVEVTDAVIRRLDSKTFTIVLRDPPAVPN